MEPSHHGPTCPASYLMQLHYRSWSRTLQSCKPPRLLLTSVDPPILALSPVATVHLLYWLATRGSARSGARLKKLAFEPRGSAGKLPCCHAFVLCYTDSVTVPILLFHFPIQSVSSFSVLFLSASHLFSAFFPDQYRFHCLPGEHVVNCCIYVLSFVKPRNLLQRK